MIKKIALIAVAVGLLLSLHLVGCGNKKPKTKGAGDADAGIEGMEPEADTGPVEYPEPPRVDPASRNPIKFVVSVEDVQVLPLSEDGRCWDSCSTETKKTLVDALPNLAGDQFASAGKALTTAMSANNIKDALPDLYVHIDCGFGQTYETSKASAEDRIVAHFQGAKETLKLSKEDYCAISVWDADDDDKDEKIGSAAVNLIKVANAGEVILKGDDQEFGQVVLVKLYLDQQEGTPVWGGNDQPSNQNNTNPTPDNKPSPKPGPITPVQPGQKTYMVEVVKANLKSQKDTGKPWDTKIPLVSDGVLPDPFVSAFVNGYESESPFMTTSNGQDATYYEWKETGTVNLAGSDKIHFMVWDKDKVDHDLVGECISDKISNLKLGTEITIKNCSQADFLVFKIIQK